jgi:hypothetical protein
MHMLGMKVNRHLKGRKESPLNRVEPIGEQAHLTLVDGNAC